MWQELGFMVKKTNKICVILRNYFELLTRF